VKAHRSNAGSLPDRLLDVKEVAAMLSVKPSTIYQWAYHRRLPAVKLFGPHGALRFRLSEVEKLIVSSERPALRSRGPEAVDSR
jgi:excisionase family DNA binding protein